MGHFLRLLVVFPTRSFLANGCDHCPLSWSRLDSTGLGAKASAFSRACLFTAACSETLIYAGEENKEERAPSWGATLYTEDCTVESSSAMQCHGSAWQGMQWIRAGRLAGRGAFRRRGGTPFLLLPRVPLKEKTHSTRNKTQAQVLSRSFFCFGSSRRSIQRREA